jgi:ferredoxin
MPKVYFKKEVREVEVPRGANLRKVAIENGISVDREQLFGVTCRGIGVCGVCKVWVREREPGATNPRGFMERGMFMRFFDGWRRLACMVRVNGDVDVWTSPGEKDRIGGERSLVPLPSPVAEARAKGLVTNADEEKAAGGGGGGGGSEEAAAEDGG